MNAPLISIGITCFNAEEYIERAIKSALNQDWTNFEIIIVDDNSLDKSYQIIRNFEKKFSIIKVFKNYKNLGIAYSRNKIIHNSKGEFIAFFDDDDESSSNRLKEQYERIIDYEKNFSKGDPVICHSSRQLIYPNSKSIIEKTMGTKKGFLAPRGIKVAKRIILGSPLKDGYGSIATCSQMSRISTYLKLGGFDVFFRRSEDTEFNIRLAIIGGHFVGISDILVKQNMTKTLDKNFAEEIYFFKKVIVKHAKLIKKFELNFALDWLNMKSFYFERRVLKLFFLLISIFLKYPINSTLRLFLSLRNTFKNLYFIEFHRNKHK